MIFSKENLTKDRLDLELKEIARRIYLTGIEEALYFPKYFQIETSRVCNAQCPFCASDQWDKSVPFMSDVLFDKIAEELEQYAHWIEFVAMQRAGEPLLDKKIVERIQRIKQAGIKFVSLSTNASLLSESKAGELLTAGLDEIMLSIDSVDRSEYAKMRVGLDYETVIRNIKNFFRIRDRIKPDVIVRVRGISFYDPNNEKHRKEYRGWEDFWNKFRKPHDRIYLKQAHNWGNQKQWDDKIPDYDWVFHPCILPWSTIHITTSGMVPLCPQDFDAKMRLGDINQHSIADTWRNDKWMNARRLHQSGQRNEISFCRGCRLFDKDFSLEQKTDRLQDSEFSERTGAIQGDGRKQPLGGLKKD